MGPAGAGQLTKMVNQICIVGVVQGLAEAKMIGAQMPGSSVIEQYYGRICAQGDGRWDYRALMDLLRE